MKSHTTLAILLVALLCTVHVVHPAPGASVDDARAGVEKALEAAKGAQSTVSGLSKGGRVSPKEAQVIKSCVVNIGDGMDMLADSLKEFPQVGGAQAGFHLDNIKTWASAALTDFDTCVDGAKDLNVNPALKSRLEGSVSNAEDLTRDALRLINEIQL